ncbi:MAG: hypothetical protein ACI8ZB_005379 [Desulforhopalus sp.]|jgi:hypothetical protein
MGVLLLSLGCLQLGGRLNRGYLRDSESNFQLCSDANSTRLTSEENMSVILIRNFLTSDEGKMTLGPTNGIKIGDQFRLGDDSSEAKLNEKYISKQFPDFSTKYEKQVFIYKSFDNFILVTDKNIYCSLTKYRGVSQIFSYITFKNDKTINSKIIVSEIVNMSVSKTGSGWITNTAGNVTDFFYYDSRLGSIDTQWPFSSNIFEYFSALFIYCKKYKEDNFLERTDSKRKIKNVNEVNGKLKKLDIRIENYFYETGERKLNRGKDKLDTLTEDYTSAYRPLIDYISQYKIRGYSEVESNDYCAHLVLKKVFDWQRFLLLSIIVYPGLIYLIHWHYFKKETHVFLTKEEDGEVVIEKKMARKL